MALLSQFGLVLPAVANRGVEKRSSESAGAQTSTPPPGPARVVASAGTVNATKVTTKAKPAPVAAPADDSAATANEEPLGPVADGPDREQLYTLMAPDGVTPIDGTNSSARAGAHLNEIGESLAYSFGRSKSGYDAWWTKFQAVMVKAKASDGELKKMIEAKKKFARQTDAHPEFAKQSAEFVVGLGTLKSKLSETRALVEGVDLAIIDIQVTLQGKEVRSAKRTEELAKKKLEERKEEVKEQQEFIKGALGVVTKFASVTEWVEILPEALGFIDEQLLAALPKAELKALEKKVEAATEELHNAEDDLDALALSSARKKLDIANLRLSSGYDAVKTAASGLAMVQQRVIVLLSSSEATQDAAKMIAARRKMVQLMADARKSGDAYQTDAAALLAECARIAELFSSYVGVVGGSKTVDRDHASAMSKTAKLNAATLKSWVAYLRSVQTEVKDGVAACSVKSDKGYMKNYNKIEPLMQDMLSGV